MTNKDILNTAMCQSAADLACEPEYFLTDTHKIVISKKMALLPNKRIGAYMRKMAIDGYIIYGDISEKDLLTVLNHVACSREQVKAAHDSFLQATEML